MNNSLALHTRICICMSYAYNTPTHSLLRGVVESYRREQWWKSLASVLQTLLRYIHVQIMIGTYMYLYMYIHVHVHVYTLHLVSQQLQVGKSRQSLTAWRIVHVHVSTGTVTDCMVYCTCTCIHWHRCAYMLGYLQDYFIFSMELISYCILHLAIHAYI